MIVLVFVMFEKFMNNFVFFLILDNCLTNPSFPLRNLNYQVDIFFMQLMECIFITNFFLFFAIWKVEINFAHKHFGKSFLIRVLAKLNLTILFIWIHELKNLFNFWFWIHFLVLKFWNLTSFCNILSLFHLFHFLLHFLHFSISILI